MTQAEKLEALVDKAVENGWEGNHFVNTNTNWKLDGNRLCGSGEHGTVEEILFNKGVARALFGVSITPFTLCNKDTKTENFTGMNDLEPVLYRPRYEVALIQTLLSDNPIDCYYREVFGSETKQ